MTRVQIPLGASKKMESLSSLLKFVSLAYLLVVITSSASALMSCSEINSAGTYYIDRGITNISGNVCFNISTDDVEINCRNYTNSINGANVNNSYAFSGNNLRNITIKNCNMTNFYSAIHFWGLSDSNIKDNRFWNLSAYSIFIAESMNNKIIGNIIKESDGIYLSHSSQQNLIKNNVFMGALKFSQGIYLDVAMHNNIENNIIKDYCTGILLEEAINNTITKDNISGNFDCITCSSAICLYKWKNGSDNNLFKNIEIADINKSCGIFIWSPTETKNINNLFINITFRNVKLPICAFNRNENNSFFGVSIENNGMYLKYGEVVIRENNISMDLISEQIPKTTLNRLRLLILLQPILTLIAILLFKKRIMG